MFAWLQIQNDKIIIICRDHSRWWSMIAQKARVFMKSTFSDSASAQKEHIVEVQFVSATKMAVHWAAVKIGRKYLGKHFQQLLQLHLKSSFSMWSNQHSNKVSQVHFQWKFSKLFHGSLFLVGRNPQPTMRHISEHLSFLNKGKSNIIKVTTFVLRCTQSNVYFLMWHDWMNMVWHYWIKGNQWKRTVLLTWRWILGWQADRLQPLGRQSQGWKEALGLQCLAPVFIDVNSPVCKIWS